MEQFIEGWSVEVLFHEKQNPFFTSLDNIIVSIFGQKAAGLIYQYIEDHYCLKRNEFCDNPAIFYKGLEDCLGPGAVPLEAQLLFDH